MSKRENGTQCIYWRVYGPWWVTFPARPVWFCPSWCHRHGRWTDVESQRAVYQRSWQRRADLALPPARRERGENERGIERRICLILNDETWRNMHALNIFTIWLVTPTVRCYVLCDGHVGWVWVHIKPKPPCSQTNPFGYCTVSLLHLPMVF